MSNTILSGITLNDYFYQSLSSQNRKMPCPLPEEFIYYSSVTLGNYALAENFFDQSEGKLKEKIYGLKYLESLSKSKFEQKEVLKDVGDSILVTLGFFSSSINKKVINESYYLDLACSSYQKLNRLDSKFYDIPNFYRLLSSSLNRVVNLLMLTAVDFKYNSLDQYLLDIDPVSKKAS